MRTWKQVVVCAVAILFGSAGPGYAFLEDLCQPRRAANGVLSWCVRPKCPVGEVFPNRACVSQLADFATIKPGRSMVHMDSTYFLAQALGYRADVAYWIAAYNEVTDYSQYAPIDQCGVQASAKNSGASFISAQFNGFVRTNAKTDGPLDHYIVNFSPNGQGTDVHGAGGVQSLYPFHYPRPGYPVRIDDTYQKTLANLRQWGMLRGTEPGVLCTVGLTQTAADGTTTCMTGGTIRGNVPVIMRGPTGIPLNVPTGKKVLNYVQNRRTDPPQITYYEALQSYLDDPAKTTGTLYLDPTPGPVPVQIARFGIYLHTLQDASSHATYCGDDAPTPPGGGDAGTYMYLDGTDVRLSFGNSCAAGPHLASHVQETGTGDDPLPLRVYVALNNTVDELIAFGNGVAKHQPGWIVNPELLPPDVTGGRNAQGQSAADLKNALVGTIVKGTAYSRAEVYQSGVVTLPLQEESSLDRLHAMNAALKQYSDGVAKKSANPSAFVPMQNLPGNSPNPNDTSVCWQPIAKASM